MLKDVKNYSFKKSFIKGEFLSFSWEGTERLMSAVNVFLILKFLSLYEYGVYQLLLSFYSIIATFSVDSIHEVVNNDLSRFLKEQKFESFKRLFSEYALIRILLGAVLTSVVFLFADNFSNRIGESVTAYLKVLSLLFFIEGFRKPLFSIFKSHLYFGLASSQALIVALVKLILFLLFINFGTFSIFWVMVAHVSAYFVSVIIMVMIFIFKFSNALKLKIFGQGVLLWEITKKYGKWAVIGEQVSRVTQNIRPWLIKFLINVEAVAIFSLAISLAGMLVSFMPLKTFSTLIPRELSNKEGLNKEGLRDIYHRSVKFIGLLGLLMAVIAYFVFPWIVALILPKYVISLPYFRAFIFIFLPFVGFAVLTRAVLVALREQKILFTRPFIQLIPIIVLSFLLLPKFQLWGTVMEYAVTYLFLAYILYRYLISVRPELKLNLRETFRFNGQDYNFIKQNAVFFINLVRSKL